jgi:hypothetical protein
MSCPRPQFHISGCFKFTAVFALFLALFHLSGIDFAFAQAGPGSVLFSLVAAFVCTCSILMRGSTSPRCQARGRSYVPWAYVRTGGLCPSCRLPKLAPPRRRRITRVSLIVLLFLFLLLPFVLLQPFSPFLTARHGGLAYPALAAGLFVLIFGLHVFWTVLRILAVPWRMSRLGYAVKVARTCAGEPGRSASLGSISVYIFGRHDPMPMLERQLETCRRRFASLTGGPVDAERPLRIFAFGRRLALEGFCRRSWLDPGNLDGIFIPWFARTIAFTTESPGYHLGDSERVVRTLLTYFHLDAFRKVPSPLWLQPGIANLVACGGDDEELARLNRKLTPALARGAALGAAELFDANPRALVRLVKDWQGLASFARYQLFVAQAWSVTEYLCGHQATDVDRRRFWALLTELKPTAPQAAVFERHYGHGFDVLLERWRAWVLDRGAGSHRPPPEPIRHALVGSVIPIVADREAAPMDRMQAIRELGRTGYVLGAEALIDVLRSGDEHLSADALWSLEAISGLDLGQGQDAVRRAEEWLAGLPKEVTGLAKTAV